MSVPFRKGGENKCNSMSGFTVYMHALAYLFLLEKGEKINEILDMKIVEVNSLLFKFFFICVGWQQFLACQTFKCAPLSEIRGNEIDYFYMYFQ